MSNYDKRATAAVAGTVDPKDLDYKNPIYERLEEDINNPWILEEQIKYYKSTEIPIAHFALPGQAKKHYYAIFDGSSEILANNMNRLNNRDAKRKSRSDKKIAEYETDSYEVMLENGYDRPKETESIDDILVYKDVLDALIKEYNELSDEKKRICNTIIEGLSQRNAAEELGMPRETYRDHKKAVMNELAKKLKSYR